LSIDSDNFYKLIVIKSLLGVKASLFSTSNIKHILFGLDRFWQKKLKRKIGLILLNSGSSGRTRTYNLVVNSHPLCRLSYRGASSH
jgi:hypothetical protein